jgi:hypothetical protein
MNIPSKTTTTAVLWAEPSGTSDVLMFLDKEVMCFIIDEHHNVPGAVWFRILTADAVLGWVMGNQVRHI